MPAGYSYPAFFMSKSLLHLKNQKNAMNRILSQLKFFLIIICSTFLLKAQKGKDGAANITAANTVVNSYYVVTASVIAGTNSVSVSSNTGLSPGDLVMLIQMQGALVNAGKDSIFPDFNSSIPTNPSFGAITNYNNCGNYEFQQIRNLPDNTTVVFDCPIKNNYNHFGKVQLVKVPRYSSLIVSGTGNIVPSAWNGTIGGVVAIEVSGNATLNASPSIDASGLGFRGGQRLNFNIPYVGGGNKWGSLLYSEGGMKGESIAGDTNRYKVYSAMYCRGAMANGGGGGNTHNAGGGGGANGGNVAAYTGSGVPISGYNTAWNLESPGFASTSSSGGGRGGYSFSSSNQNPNSVAPGNSSWGGDNRRIVGGMGGRPLDYSIDRLFMGGGGGAGHGNNSLASSGGNGGGIIYLIIDGNLTGSGTILSNGANAANTTQSCSDNDGAGGGGGGGAIVLNVGGSISLSNPQPLQARGGNGGNVAFNCFFSNAQSYGPGGGGGGGYIASNQTLPPLSVAGGTNGVHTGNNNLIQQNFPPNGATMGGTGSTGTVSSFPVISYTNATVCVNNSATLTAISGTNSILWYNTLTGGTSLFTGTSYVTPVFSSPGTYTYYAGSCPGIYRQPVIVTVLNVPTVTVNSPTLCSGQQVTLTASGATSYSWNTGATTPTIVVSPASTTQYTVSGTTSGCTSSTVSTVQVSPTPTVNTTSATVCMGQTATLTASGAASYTWNTGSNSFSISVNPTVNTTYTVTGSNGTCTSQATAQVTVNPNPTITVNSAAICSGNSATLTASGASSYTWSTGSGGSSVVVTPTASSQYTVWGSSGTCSSSSTATVSIIPGPTLTINPLQICMGQSGTLVATGATSYTWNTGANSSSISVNPTVNTTYTLIGSNGTCTSQVTSQVTVNPNPTITVNSATVCSGSNATLVASGASSYTWSTGSGGSSVVVNPTTQTVYTVSGSNSFGCNSSATATVNITSSPTLALNATLFSLCGNQQATIVASSNYTNFNWSTGSTNSFIIVNTAGVYQVTVSSPCGSSVQSATVTTGNAPVFTIVPSSSLLCTGQTITLSTTGSSGTLQWSNGSGSSSITINQSGIYTATLSNACGSATQSIAINDGPSTSLNIISSSPTLCAGDQVTVTANGTGTINWSTGANNTSSIIVNTQGVYTASLSNYCGTAVQQITLYPGPSPDVTIAATSTAICNNGASTLTAFGNAPASYSWAGISSGATLVVTSPGTYSAIAYNNCGVSMATIQISQPAAPLLTVTPSSTILCSGGQVTLIANGLNGNNSYTWNTTPSSSNTFVVTTPGNYSVTYGNACGTITQTIDIVPSAVSASISANPSSGYPPLVVSFSNFSSGNVTNVWNLGNGNTSTLNIPPGQQYTSPGIYTITLLVSDANGCTSVASVTIEVLDTPFGIIPELVTPDGDGKNDVFEIKGIEKYPNNEIEIYNRWGNLVYKKSGYKNEWDGRPNVTSMGKDRLPSATYFYILKLNDASQTIYKGFVVLMY